MKLFFSAPLCLCGEIDLMELNGKRVLVVGLGKSGVASALFLKGARGAGDRL
jgi:thioredoxin reductase